MAGDPLAPAPLSERIRTLTSRAVTAALGLGLVCFLAGLARGLPAGDVVVRPGALPGALARADAGALVSLGVLLLAAAPITRVLGLVVGFWHDRDRAALAAALGMLVMLALTFVGVRAE